MAMKARLDLRIELRNGRSVLADCYHTQPFKVMDVTLDRRGRDLHLMLMSASPGLLNGDEQQMNIEVGAGAELHLVTQAYQRLFPMSGSAKQCVEAHIGTGSALWYLPHPVVPHRASALDAINRFYLAPGARLLWGEVLTCGRKWSGESWQFTRYSCTTDVYLENRLAVRERVRIEPSLVDQNVAGLMEGFSHQATLIYIDDVLDVKAATEAVLLLLGGDEAVAGGVSALPVNGVSLRLLGNGAERLFALLQAAAGLLRAQAILDSDPVNTKDPCPVA